MSEEESAQGAPGPPVAVDAESSEAGPAIGTILAGRYRIDELLGEGGMGKVYAAEHVLMKKRLAVKLLHRALTSVPEVIARFEREAMAAANIDHPNVAAATDFGKLEDGSVFLVLEYVQGRSLRDEVEGGAISVERSLHIGRQIAHGLAAAHALEIVHRDLKPENVMLITKGSDNDFVKVLDFGVAKVPFGDSAQPGAITRAGMVFGTPEYMAPEQALGQGVDGRADLYALGVILYEMLSGVRPFTSESSVGVLAQQLSKTPMPFAQRGANLGVPPQVESLVFKLLSRDASSRYASANDLILELNELLAPLPTRGARRFTLTSGSPTSTATEPEAAPAAPAPAAAAAPAPAPARAPAAAPAARAPAPAPAARAPAARAPAPAPAARAPAARAPAPAPAKPVVAKPTFLPSDPLPAFTMPKLDVSKLAVKPAPSTAPKTSSVPRPPDAAAAGAPPPPPLASAPTPPVEPPSPPPNVGKPTFLPSDPLPAFTFPPVGGAGGGLPSVAATTGTAATELAAPSVAGAADSAAPHPNTIPAPPTPAAGPSPVVRALAVIRPVALRGATLARQYSLTAIAATRRAFDVASTWVDAHRSALPRWLRRPLRDVPARVIVGSAAFLVLCLFVGLVLAVSGSSKHVAAPVASASAAPSSSAPSADDGVRRRIEDAQKEGTAALERLSTELPKSSEVWLALADAQMRDGKASTAVASVGRALSLSADSNKDDRSATVLAKAIRMSASDDAALALLEGPMGTKGGEILFDVSQSGQVPSDTRRRALTWIASDEFHRLAGPALAISGALVTANKCTDKHELLEQAGRVGDVRTLSYLKLLSSPTGCGRGSRNDCYPCLRRDDQLKQAIAAIEARTGGKH